MLIINGEFMWIDHPILVERFGFSYERSERLGDWIAALIEDRAENRYNSVDHMSREFVDRNIHNPLPIRFVNREFPQGVNIIMTGSRDLDAREANRQLGLNAAPEGYTWHHCENIVHVGRRRYSCTMMLIQSWYHNSTPHQGGVHEYELFVRERYH